jgi:stress response protein SCP2
MSIQSILLRRANKIMVSGTRAKGVKTLTTAEVATFNLNLQSIGYTLSAQAIEALQRVSHLAANGLLEEIVSTLKELKGVRAYRPMYPNFPQQVIDASDAELYINAIIHYFSFAMVDLTGDQAKIWLPKYDKAVRATLNDRVHLQVINVMTEKDVEDLATRIATSNTSISATDKADLKVFYDAGYLGFPAVVPNKENLAVITTIFWTGIVASSLFHYFKTATDVLRLATALSDGDVSLAEDSKFRSFNRHERRQLLSMLEQIDNKEEDMLRFPARWIRLGERLHPGDYAKALPTTYTAFAKLRNNAKIVTFRSQVEQAIRDRRILDAIKLLKQRPGEFARRIDHLLRLSAPGKIMQVATGFLEVANKVSTPVLLQALTHFQHRQDEEPMRVVFPKGNVAKVMTLDKQLPMVPHSITGFLELGITSVLVDRFSALPSLGKVYVDELLRDHLVPFSQRSASKALRTLVRGSKLPFGEDKDTVRFFIWWKQPENDRVDLDLSAVLYDENWKHTVEIAFYNLRNGFARHSGDITSAPNGASEFIDVDIPQAIDNGVRYVVMSVHGFTEQNFCDLPECFAGAMLRDKPQSGEIYDPRTVENKVDVSMAARSGVPMIIDLVDRKMIWVDAAIKATPGYGSSVANTRGSI